MEMERELNRKEEEPGNLAGASRPGSLPMSPDRKPAGSSRLLFQTASFLCSVTVKYCSSLLQSWQKKTDKVLKAGQITDHQTDYIKSTGSLKVSRSILG